MLRPTHDDDKAWRLLEEGALAFDFGSSALLGEQDVRHMSARLELTPAASQGALNDRQKRQRPEWPFQEGDVAERPHEAKCPCAAYRAAAMFRNDDDR
jgi:hypothetical protein